MGGWVGGWIDGSDQGLGEFITAFSVYHIFFIFLQ